jgi:hypothetical protein
MMAILLLYSFVIVALRSGADAQAQCTTLAARESLDQADTVRGTR